MEELREDIAELRRSAAVGNGSDGVNRDGKNNLTTTVYPDGTASLTFTCGIPVADSSTGVPNVATATRSMRPARLCSPRGSV
ncbi:hypothetical protein ACWGKW_36290 [Streptomyces sp. NPDC054766]